MTNAMKQAMHSILNNGIQDKMDMELSRKIRLLNVFCFIGIVFIIPISIQTFFLGHYFILSMDLLALSFFITSFIYLRRTSTFSFASHVLVHALFFLLLYFVYSGGVEGTGPVWIFIFPIVALSLYELKRGITYTALFTLILLVCLFLPTRLLGAFEYPIEFKFRIFCSYSIVTILAMVYEYFRRETFLRMQELSTQLDVISKHDSLTGLMNRRGIYDRLEHEQARISRKNDIFSIIIGDIDKFKTINDKYGHDVGDHVLKMIPRIFSAHIRAQDTVARWGGEEFLFLLPETDLKGAYILGEKIRKAVQERTIDYSGQQVGVTMSFGIVEISPGCSHEDGIIMADRYLFEAKNKGRNQILPIPKE